MSGIARVGDPVTCGDVCAQGSPNVFINGMPVVRQNIDHTAGHCYTPTIFPTVAAASAKVFCNGIAVVTMGDQIAQHCCDDDCHVGTLAVGSPDVKVG